MGIFDFFKRTDIDQGVKAYQETPGAILLDVRTAEEFRGGRIPGSNHVPLQSIGKVTAVVKDKSIPIFVYCQSGARSRMAANTLRRMGYESATDIGGISAYSGARSSAESKSMIQMEGFVCGSGEKETQSLGG